jgi:signal transduction histidine kinase
MARETTGAKYAALGVLGEHGTLVDFIHTGMTPRQADAIGSPPIGKGVLGLLISEPSPLILDEISQHPASSGFPAHHPEMHTFLGVPVLIAGKAFGNLYLAEKMGGFTDDDRRVVEALATIAGSAVSSARLNARLTRVALAEDRERIARDLHDAVIQDLFAVGLSLQGAAMTVTDETLAARLDDAVDRIDESIGALRTFIFDIRTMGHSIADPRTTVQRMVQRLTANCSAHVTVEVAPMALSTPDALADALQIVRESVSNAVRHANPSNIDVSVAARDSHIMVIVTDDGCGFDPVTAPRGMGLDNLAGRVRERSGDVSIESAPGVGTTVTATIPFTAESSAFDQS